jgi:hypothetical protein
MEWETIGLWGVVTALAVGIIWLLWCAIGNR